MAEISRGLSPKLIAALNGSLIKFLFNDGEMFVAIRSEFINLYYLGAVLGKIDLYQGELRVTIAKKYTDLSLGAGYLSLTVQDFVNNLKAYKSNIAVMAESPVKRQLQKLVLANNQNPKSKWYCLDFDYVTTGENKKNNVGHFDVLAVAKATGHAVALIKFHLGAGAFGGVKADKYGDANYTQTQFRTQVKAGFYGDFPTVDATFNKLGNGLVGQVFDGLRYLKSHKMMAQLKKDILTLVKIYKLLGISTSLADVNKNNLAAKPSIYLITREETGQETALMGKYLFNFAGAAEYNVQKILGIDVRSRGNYNFDFLFAPAKVQITDILADPGYKKRG